MTDDTHSARNGARAIIIAALITAVGTIGAATLGLWISDWSLKGEAFRTLTITRVEPQGSHAMDGYRLKIYVNGHSYSFPTEKLWGEFGVVTTSGRLIVKRADKYDIRMTSWIKMSPEPKEFGSSQVQEVSDKSDLKAEQRYSTQRALVKYQVE